MKHKFTAVFLALLMAMSAGLVAACGEEKTPSGENPPAVNPGDTEKDPEKNPGENPSDPGEDPGENPSDPGKDPEEKPNYPEHEHIYTAENVCSVCGAKWEYTEILNYEFDRETDSYIVSNNSFANGDIVIPYGVNGKFVTRIKVYAFKGCTGLTGITIPDSVTAIETGAFVNCSELKNITIPNSVTSIEDNVFEGCTALTGITIPDSVTSIGLGAFMDCTGLTSIEIPDSVTSIGGSAFEGTAYYQDETNWDTQGVLYLGNHLIKAREEIAGSYTIRQGTKNIAYGAFADRTGLTSVEIPDSVTSIGDSVFNRIRDTAKNQKILLKQSLSRA